FDRGADRAEREPIDAQVRSPTSYRDSYGDVGRAEERCVAHAACDAEPDGAAGPREHEPQIADTSPQLDSGYIHGRKVSVDHAGAAPKRKLPGDPGIQRDLSANPVAVEQAPLVAVGHPHVPLVGGHFRRGALE